MLLRNLLERLRRKTSSNKRSEAFQLGYEMGREEVIREFGLEVETVKHHMALILDGKIVRRENLTPGTEGRRKS